MTIKLEIDHVNEKNRSIQQLPKEKKPEFTEYKPDIDKIERKAEEQDCENIIVIGNGGSVTSLRAYLYAFIDEVDTDVRIVTTMDPDYLGRLSRELTPENTLVMPISKSGDTVGVIESLMYFLERGYPAFAVTSDNEGALKQIVDRKDLDWIQHPEIGGRFSGLTETALLPAAFAGIDVREIREGAKEMYEKLSPQNQYNPALNLASALYDAEQKGFNEVLTPFYSTRLFGFYPLFVQLMHETVCKEGKGQTVYGDLGPEYQHHTNQRLFGGKQNVIPLFFRCEAHERHRVNIPEDLSDVKIRGEDLSHLETLTYSESLKSEYQGVKNALDEEEKPNVTLNIGDVSHKNIGKLMAFIQYTAVYSAWLRDVNPFNQPDVEKSKQLGFEERFKK